MLTDTKLQIYLPGSMAAKLRRKAKADGKKVAQIVRESLEIYLARTPAQQAQEAFASLDQMVGTFRDDGSGASVHHDEILGSGRW